MELRFRSGPSPSNQAAALKQRPSSWLPTHLQAVLATSQRSVSAPAITLDREPLALRSTRNRPRRAVRRGAAWPAERPSSCLVVREAVSRWQVASRRAGMGCRALQAPSTGTRLGVPARVRSAWWSRRSGGRPCLVTVSASSASVRRPVSGASVQCPRVPVHASVRCPVRASERPGVGVRRPVWASGVRAVPRPLCPTGVRSWSAAVGQAAARLGWPGSAWSPAVSTTGSSAARGRSMALEAGAGRAGPAEASARTWPSSQVVGQWPGRLRADQDRPDAHEDRRR